MSAVARRSPANSPALGEKRLLMFLRFLSETGRVDYAAMCAGFADTSPLYRRRKDDRDFAEAWALAIEMAGDRFEAEASRRGMEGVAEPVFHKGEICGYKQVYSDSLLAKLMDGAKPGKYRHNVTEQRVEVTGRVGLAVIPMTAKNVEEWEKECAQLHGPAQPAMIDVTPQKVEAAVTAPGTKLIIKV